MRYVEFRVLDKSNNWVHFSVFHSGADVYDFKKETLSEFIGRKDIKKQDIFEGDIVSCKSNSYMPREIELFEVYYDKLECAFLLKEYAEEVKGYPKFILEFSNAYKIEILGNKYDKKGRF